MMLFQEARDDHKRWMAIFGETQNGFFKNLAEIPKRRTKRRNQKLAERVAHGMSSIFQIIS